MFVIGSQCRSDIGVMVFVSWVNYHTQTDPFFQVSCFNSNLIWDLLCRVQNAEVLCLGLVSVAVFMIVIPLFRATGGVLLQMVPPSIPTSALSKCLRQVCDKHAFYHLLRKL